MTDLAPMRRALLSVSDKAGLIDLARALAGHGIELLSTGGTAKALRAAGLGIRDVSGVTGFPEMMGGRVKTLHPHVHGGLLARRDNEVHMASAQAHGIGMIDLLVVNLYPFEAAVAAGADHAAVARNIDIGGPAMIRAAAKNHDFVAVVVDIGDYPVLLTELRRNDGFTTLPFRRELAMTAYSRTAAYDAAIAGWMAARQENIAPRRMALTGYRDQMLRYGENPHQKAAFYIDGSDREGVATATRHQGKALSYNNISDTSAAFELVAEFDPAESAACAIVKHATPCGVALGATLPDAWRAAFDCDRDSAFGGVVALNRPLDEATAQAITGIFTEVVIAPGASDAAKAVLAARRNLRLLTTSSLPDPRAPGSILTQVAGGFLLQDRDTGHLAADALKVVTRRAPTDAEMADLLFAWKVVRHVKSNAIVYVRGGATVGIGGGQTSRIDSTLIATSKAERMAGALGLSEPPTKGAVVASDAFFPFADGLMQAAAAGAGTVIQPGGSIRDAEVIAAADAAGLAMVFTGMRHFRH